MIVETTGGGLTQTTEAQPSAPSLHCELMELTGILNKAAQDAEKTEDGQVAAGTRIRVALATVMTRAKELRKRVLGMRPKKETVKNAWDMTNS